MKTLLEKCKGKSDYECFLIQIQEILTQWQKDYHCPLGLDEVMEKIKQVCVWEGINWMLDEVREIHPKREILDQINLHLQDMQRHLDALEDNLKKIMGGE